MRRPCWISEDPIGFRAADVNLFRYVTNNPANQVDASGCLSWTVSPITLGLGGDYGWPVTFLPNKNEQNGFIVQEVSVKFTFSWEEPNSQGTEHTTSYPDVVVADTAQAKLAHFWEIWEVENGKVWTTLGPKVRQVKGDTFTMTGTGAESLGLLRVWGTVYWDNGKKVGKKLVPTDGWALWMKTVSAYTGPLLSSAVKPSGLQSTGLVRSVFEYWDGLGRITGTPFSQRIAAATFGNGVLPYGSQILTGDPPRPPLW